jgi:probable HAF family extracellular repeat protein
VLSSAGAALLGAAPVAPAQEAWFRGIGDLPGGLSDSAAAAISAEGGSVAGFSRGTAGLTGFRWRDQEGMAPIGGAPGMEHCLAKGASRDGSVVVGYLREGRTEQGFVWTLPLGLRRIGVLLGGDQSMALAISASGNVAVGQSRSAVGTEAVRITFLSGIQTLGDLGGGAVNSCAFGVSDNGTVVVGVGTTSSGRQGFRWNEGGGMQAIPGTAGGSAVCVSGNGLVVAGVVPVVPSAAGYEAYKWTAGGGLVRLGDLPGGALQSEAIAISGDGSVIVGAGHDSQGGAAFVWDATWGMRSIRRELARVPGADGWRLSCATGVSADGRTVTGFGINPGGRREAWIARLPATGCAVDWDRSGRIDSTDLFMFLSDFQSGDADYNNDGVTTSQDLFEYFIDFQVGCG